MSKSTVVLVAACGAAFTAACGGMPEGPSWQGSITDSAGVVMVANPEIGVWNPEDVWDFVEEYRLGGMDAAEEAQFGLVVARRGCGPPEAIIAL